MTRTWKGNGGLYLYEVNTLTQITVMYRQLEFNDLILNNIFYIMRNEMKDDTFAFRNVSYFCDNY